MATKTSYRRAIAWLLILGQLMLVGCGGRTARSGKTWQEHRDQAGLYLKRDLHKQALGQIQMAYSFDAGKKDPETVVLHARILYKLLRVTEAARFVTEAEKLFAELSKKPEGQDDQRARLKLQRPLQELAAEIRSQYASFTLVQAPRCKEDSLPCPSSGRLAIKPKMGLINKRKKKVVSELRRLRFEIGQTVYIPQGEYQINGVWVRVDPDALVLGGGVSSKERKLPVILIQDQLAQRLTQQVQPADSGWSTETWIFVGVAGALAIGFGAYALTRDDKKPAGDPPVSIITHASESP